MAEKNKNNYEQSSDSIESAFIQEEFEEENYEDYDVQKKSGGLFSRLKRKKKDDDDDGYDIFDLDDPFEEVRAKRNARIEREEKKRKEKREKEEKKLQQQRINERRQRAAEMSERRAQRARRMAMQEEQDVKIYNPNPAESDEMGYSENDDYSDDEINKVLTSVGLTPLSTNLNEQDSEDGFEKVDEDDTKTAEKSDESAKAYDYEDLQSDEDSDAEKPESETKVIDKTAVLQTIDSLQKEKAQEQSEEAGEEKSGEAEKVSGKTRLFDIKKLLSGKKLDSQGDQGGKSKGKKKRFIDNFRVLEKPVQDKPILERAPVTEANANVADSIDTDDYDDIFAAVEQNEKFDTKTIQSNALKENAKKKKAGANAVIKELKQKESGQKTRIYILIGITAASVLLSLFSVAYKPNGALEFMFGSGARLYSLFSLLIFAAGAVSCIDIIKHAIASLKKTEFNSAVCTFLISAATAVHLLISLIAGMNEISGFVNFTAFALFLLLCERVSMLIFDKNLQKNLSVLVKNKSLIGLQPIDNETDADVLGYGLNKKGEPIIYYSAETALPTDIERASCCDSTDEPLYGTMGIAVLVLSLCASLAFTIFQKSTVAFAALFIGAICLSFPSLKKLLNALLSRDCSAISNKSGSCILSFDHGVKFGESHAFIIDSDSLFKASVSKFRAVPRGAITQSDCVVFTAAALKNTRSLIRNCFDDFLEETGITLPEAQEVQYEENLGYSAWIAERRVLVGNRAMLLNHNVECPSQQEEDAYSKGRKVLYLAVEGKIAATFIVSYKERADIKKSAQKLSKNGVVLMISSSDPFITENDISSKLGIELAAIKVVNTKGAEILAAYQKPTVKRYDNGLLCSKKYANMLTLVNCAISLSRAHKLSRFVYLIGCAATFILFVALTALGANAIVTAPAAILFQCAWGAVAYFAGRTRLEKNP